MKWLIEGGDAPAPGAPKKSAAELDREIRIAQYEEKQEAKRERLEAAAGKARREAASRSRAAQQVLDIIPMGQPILVGHHSERRHRRDLERVDNNIRKSIEAEKRAADLAGRAAAIGTGGISSDDPAAVQKLRAELAPLVKRQEGMKAANAAIRKHAKAGPEAQIAALVALGHHPKAAARLLEKDFAGRIGFADYEITNNGANIRRIEKRIAELLTKEATPAAADVVGSVESDGKPLGFRIEENKDVNRVQIHFDGKPSETIRAKLKSAGFRWAPTEGAWQRQASNGAWYHAKRALGVTS